VGQVNRAQSDPLVLGVLLASVDLLVVSDLRVQTARKACPVPMVPQEHPEFRVLMVPTASVDPVELVVVVDPMVPVAALGDPVVVDLPAFGEDGVTAVLAVNAAAVGAQVSLAVVAHHPCDRAAFTVVSSTS